MANNKKAISTQSLVNSYPKWSKTRNDEQSIGYQFLNSIGGSLDDLIQQSAIIGDNYFLSSANVRDIDLYYRFRLPGDYEFTKEDNDNTELIYTPPIVSGILNSVQYAIEIAEDNNIESFWYTAVPDRISLGEVVSGQYLIASGFAYLSPLSSLPVSGVIYPPNKLSITLTSGEQFVYIDDDNRPHGALIQITGESRAGVSITEEISFVENETIKTQHDFSRYDETKILDVRNLESTFVTITSANFQQEDYPTAYNFSVDLDKEDQELFWAIGSGYSTNSTLDLKRHELNDVLLRAQGFDKKYPILRQDLLNIDENIIQAVDLSVEARSDNLWVVDSGILYLYSADLPYQDCTLLINKDYDAPSVIEPNSYLVLLGEEVQLDYIWARPVQGFIRHRISVIKPDGNKYSIEDGAFVTFHTDSESWIFGEPRERSIRPTDFFTLDQRGNWVFILEAKYTDDTTSIDKRIITVASQIAKAQFDLRGIGIPHAIQGIDFDSENKMWVLDSTGGRYEIKRHYDNMLVDFSKKILYFRESYDQIRVY